MSLYLIKNFPKYQDKIFENLKPFLIKELKGRDKSTIDYFVIQNKLSFLLEYLFPPEIFGDNSILKEQLNNYIIRNNILSDVFLALDNANLQENYDENLDEKLNNLKNLILKDYHDVIINSDMSIDEFDKRIGYKNKITRQKLNELNYGRYRAPPSVKKFNINYFPLKENIKKYSLHTIAPKDTFLIDLMFDNDYTYLIMININTRKLRAEQTNLNTAEIQNKSKSAIAVREALKRIMKQMERNKKIKLLKGDSEKAFLSDEFFKFLHERNIDFKPMDKVNITRFPKFMENNKNLQNVINKTKPKSTSLGIINRVIRTIRDLAFNMEKPVIDPITLRNIVWQYNNAPHKTLSKYAGQLVSPNDVDGDEKLEAFIVRRIQQENYKILSSSTFDIKINQPIRVYNEKAKDVKRRSVVEPGNWRINKRLGTIFEIIDEKGNIENKSRYQIDYI